MSKALYEKVEILIVEDDHRQAKILADIISSDISQSVYTVRDGIDAMEMLFSKGVYEYRKDKSLPLLLIVDLVLPRLDGFDLIEKLKLDAATKNIPVIVITVSNKSSDREKCEELGVSGYFVKPIEVENFINTVKKTLAAV